MKSKLGRGILRVAYCGPIAKPGQPARGGYEAANRRLIDDLRLRGLSVMELAYPVALGSQFAKGVTYARRFTEIAVGLVQRRRSFDIFHLTPLYRQFLAAEALLCMVAWGLGKRVVFDIRAGTFLHDYRRGTGFYRSLADRLLRRADILAVEGQEDLAFIEERRRRPVLYLPNYVRATATVHDVVRDHSMIRLVFLGRIVSEKGIETAIETLSSLLDMGHAVLFNVIGGGEEAYIRLLQERTAGLPVCWSGPLSPEAIGPKLAAAHFFIFPTKHFGEGHSNALTEAMAAGVVPICSENGFSRSVVGHTGEVLPIDASPQDYADIISLIWRTGRWPALSAAARDRVTNNFTGDTVLPALVEGYTSVAITRRS